MNRLWFICRGLWMSEASWYDTLYWAYLMLILPSEQINIFVEFERKAIERRRAER